MNKVFNLKSYFYDLPEYLIAQYPLEKRDQAKLMIIDRHKERIMHDHFFNLDQYLPDNTNFVINNSKVIPARLLGVKADTGGEVEVFLLKSLNDGCSFEALLKPLKKIRVGQVLDFGEDLKAQLVDKEKRIVRFNHKDILKILEKKGHIPLPPYIKRDDESSDHKDYQTVYAKSLGSVAAPTAGLHFTRPLMKNLKHKGHQFIDLSLHIGYGTFKPVECKDIRLHMMHTESYEISKVSYQKILDARSHQKVLCAVGTTSCRVLESVSKTGDLRGQTNIFVYPGFSFTMTDCLVTNFHLPYSSLLMLVCAFGGYDLIMEAYKQAIKNQYRFYSYGDAMLIV